MQRLDLEVALGERAYRIHIGAGLLDRPALLREAIGGRQALLLSNTTIAPLYAQKVEAALDACR